MKHAWEELGLDGPDFGVLRLFMPAEVDLPLEGPTADVAGERLEARVLATVRDEVGRLAERLSAHGAFVWLLACEKNKTDGDTVRLLLRYRVQH